MESGRLPVLLLSRCCGCVADSSCRVGRHGLPNDARGSNHRRACTVFESGRQGLEGSSQDHYVRLVLLFPSALRSRLTYVLCEPSQFFIFQRTGSSRRSLRTPHGLTQTTTESKLHDLRRWRWHRRTLFPYVFMTLPAHRDK
jgi:hypothetical protein